MFILILIVLVHITDTQWNVRRQKRTPYLNRTQLLKPVIYLGLFAKLRKTTVCFIMSCLSVRKTQLEFHWTDFHEIWYFAYFS